MRKLIFHILLAYAITGMAQACKVKQDIQQVKSGYVAVSGNARIYFEEKGQGTPIMLLPGHSLDTRMWNGQFDEFAKHHRVVRFDFRGYGKSSEQTETFQFTHLDDLLTLMDSLHIEKAHIVGLSMGGFIAGDMLGIAPERMLSCVLASGGPKTQKGPSEPMDGAEKAKRDIDIAALKAKGVDKMKEEWLEALMASGGSRKECMREPLRIMITDWTAWQPLHKEVRLIYGMDAVKQLKQKCPTVPTLILEGGAPGNKHSGKSWLTEFLPNSRVEVLPDCGHMMNIEQPELFNKAVLDFINKN